MAFLDSPVDAYHSSLEAVHGFVRANAPFTYIAYSSLIPEVGDDWIEIAGKVADYVTFRFFIQLAQVCWSSYFGWLPFLPFVLDIAWQGHRMGSRSLTSIDLEIEEMPAARRVRALGAVFLASLSVSFLQRNLPSMI